MAGFGSEDANTSVALLEAGGECNNRVVNSPGVSFK